MNNNEAFLPKPRRLAPFLLILEYVLKFRKKALMSYNIKYGLPYTISNMFMLGSFLTLLSVLFNSGSYLIVFKVLSIKSLDWDLCLFLDWMGLLFFRVLRIIVSCVLKFSCIYMEKDVFQTRFTLIVLSFVFSMTCLIFIPHFLFLLIGWDGLGITSFLLVIYYLRSSSWGAGMKTYLINRVGDRFFILALVVFMFKGYWEINTVGEKSLLAVIVVLGCFTKRAQFPFSSWLPAAMAAPTPVSSLVHSSTLVTAGIYLMIRFCHMFPNWLFIMIGVCGMWTLYSARLAACCEYDAKKVVAYSTLSQLGLMRVSISLNLPHFAFFHLITHAVFKALIFICVGYLIKKRGHFQDLRRLKGLWSSSPLISLTLLISKFRLLGFPYLRGFFSKELILEKKILIMKWVFQLLLTYSLPLTSYYRCRLPFSVFKGDTRNRISCKKDENVLLSSILPLYLGSIVVGRLLYSDFYRLSLIFPCQTMKLKVLLVIALGATLAWKDIKIKRNSLIWFCSTISFLVPFNRSFWNNHLRNAGSTIFYMLDQGALRRAIYRTDEGITSSGRWLARSRQYFSHPNIRYYMVSIGGLSLFIRRLL